MMFWLHSPGCLLKSGDGGGEENGEVLVANRSAATFLDGWVICSIFAEMLQQF